jgi:hypothetical protein
MPKEVSHRAASDGEQARATNRVVIAEVGWRVLVAKILGLIHAVGVGFVIVEDMWTEDLFTVDDELPGYQPPVAGVHLV